MKPTSLTPEQIKRNNGYTPDLPMKKTLKAVVTIVQTYDADPKDYKNCEFVEDMIDMDKKNFKADPMMFVIDMMETGTAEITIAEKI